MLIILTPIHTLILMSITIIIITEDIMEDINHMDTETMDTMATRDTMDTIVRTIGEEGSKLCMECWN